MGIHPSLDQWSETDPKQGDPLGPLFFSLVLKEVTHRISEKYQDLKLSVWYLDDGTVAGPQQALAEILQLLEVTS